jgi:hypothetical protein
MNLACNSGARARKISAAYQKTRVWRCTAWVLGLACADANAVAIVGAGAIDALLSLLSAPAAFVKRVAATALYFLTNNGVCRFRGKFASRLIRVPRRN